MVGQLTIDKRRECLVTSLSVCLSQVAHVRFEETLLQLTKPALPFALSYRVGQV